MNEVKYEVLYMDAVIATFTSIRDVMIFIKALDEEYYAEPDWNYTVRRVNSLHS